jgi:radical SAM superfamily enzyme YgiQ (UPF0313 family)
MSDAGCYAVYIGLESVNPETLKHYNKAQNMAAIKNSIKTFHDYGINVHGMFVLGSDKDDKNVFRQTSDFCSDYKIDTAQFSILTPLPGTPVYHNLYNENRLLHNIWKFYDGLHVVFKPKKMTAFELQTGMLDTFKDFYSYTQGVKKMFNESISAGIKKIKSTFANVNIPYPTFHYKFAGKHILRKWVKQNLDYIEYLRKEYPIKSFLAKKV